MTLLGKKRGRPSGGGRELNKEFHLRMSEDEAKLLDYISEKMKLSKSRVLRLLIYLQYERLKKLN